MNELKPNTKTTIFVTVRQPGFHYWPDAPDTVKFLSSLHRHVFTVRACVRVHDDDRETEFFLFQRALRKAVTRVGEAGPDGLDFGAQSCEMLARAVMEQLGRWDDVLHWVEVWEDDENGARVETLNHE